MKTQAIVLLIATLSTGIMAGIFFTWSNTVTTGLARLSDLEYLRAFQSMNRTILNPAFFLAFLSPVVLLPLSAYFHYKVPPSYLFWMLLIASVLYMAGVILVTFTGNIPLNTILEGSSLDSMTLTDVKSLRAGFENKWNTLNWIRTYCSLFTFLLLVGVCIVRNN